MWTTNCKLMFVFGKITKINGKISLVQARNDHQLHFVHNLKDEQNVCRRQPDQRQFLTDSELSIISPDLYLNVFRNATYKDKIPVYFL